MAGAAAQRSGGHGLVRGCAQSHMALAVSLVAASIVAAIVYELTSGGKPRAFIYDDPQLNYLDRRGDQPTQLWRHGEFECLGWRATHNCDPHGQRDPLRDRACNEPMTRVSGYCEVRNTTSGEVMRVMLSTCKSWQWWLVEKKLSCNDAQQFTDFSVLAATYKHVAPLDSPLKHKPSAIATATDDDKIVSFERGITMIGYPKVIAGLYAIVRLLRYHGCVLPVEVWIDPLEMQATHSVLVELVRNYNVIVRTIVDPTATKFHAKPYAMYNSYFESVLFLDSDNIPVQDPTYLFDSPEFLKYGAMFWPDFWRPTPTTPFNVHEQSTLWQLLDMPFIDMFEQESGQLLVNRRRSAAALNKLMFYSAHIPRLLTDWHLVYGDKDLFRLAWLNTSTPFYYVPHVVALGGIFDEEENFFCGIAMVQRDPKGDIIFLHRNQAKLNGRRDQKVLITHLQKFTGGNGDASSLKQDLDKYRVQCKMHRLDQYVCFLINPKAPDGSDTPYLIQSLASTKYPVCEKQAIHFSVEGRNLLTKAEEAVIADAEYKEQQKQDAETKSQERARRKSDRNLKLIWVVGLISVGLAFYAIRTFTMRRRATATKAKDTSSSLPAMTSSTASSGGAIHASHISLSVESSWRRKKSPFAREDEHIL